MKRTLALIIAVLFVFAVAAVSFAAEEKKAAEPAKKEAASAKKTAAKKAQVTGEIKSIDTTAKTITVVKKTKKGKETETVIAVDDKMLAEIKAGDRVRVEYTAADGKNTAKKITKLEAKKAETKKPAEKK